MTMTPEEKSKLLGELAFAGTRALRGPYPGEEAQPAPPAQAPRVEYPTGAVRKDAAGQGRYDLLPMEALRRLALQYERGAAEYGDENWRKGYPTRTCVASAMRHLCKYMQGHRDEDHLAAVMWNVAAVIEIQDMIWRGLLEPSLDNLPNWTGGYGPEGPRGPHP